MIKLKTLIRENNNINNIITIDDIDNILVKGFVSWDVKSTLGILEKWYYSQNLEEQRWVKEYINLLNKIGIFVLNIVKHLQIPHVSIKEIKSYLLGQTEFHMKEDEFFPFPLYISSSPQDEATVGILIDKTGKILEIHEGNDEASSETIQMVNKLVNPVGKKVRIYGSHNRNLVFQIQEKEILPANVYVSPNKGHAESYRDIEGERETFTGIIDINSVNQESDLDWKITSPTKIEKFRFI